MSCYRVEIFPSVDFPGWWSWRFVSPDGALFDSEGVLLSVPDADRLAEQDAALLARQQAIAIRLASLISQLQSEGYKNWEISSALRDAAAFLPGDENWLPEELSIQNSDRLPDELREEQQEE